MNFGPIRAGETAGGCGVGLGPENEGLSDPLCSEAQKFRE